jgi:hypothetical protein
MGYDLIARNKKIDSFYFGAFSFPVLLDACGYLFPCIHNEGKWYCVFGVDDRFPREHTYPAILCNDGFRVTSEEAHIMARMARNLVVIQRELAKEQLESPKQKSMLDIDEERWPMAVRSDFVDKFERFAEWAEKSGGFSIR